MHDEHPDRGFIDARRTCGPGILTTNPFENAWKLLDVAVLLLELLRLYEKHKHPPDDDDDDESKCFMSSVDVEACVTRITTSFTMRNAIGNPGNRPFTPLPAAPSTHEISLFTL